MNNRKFKEEDKDPKQKAIEIVPIIVAAIVLIIALSLKEFSVLKIALLAFAALIGVGMYVFVLIREIINRRKNKRDK
ncbi:MAG: hypothetical protein IKU25_08990 [Clostridia bacterium]|nr:hypothetical protein [Clostridia bacterium]